MSNNLYTASRQWAERPNDERYWTIQEAFLAAKGMKDSSRSVDISLQQLKCYTDGTEIIVNGKMDAATLTNHGFNDLCRNIGAPANFLRTLTPELVANTIQEKLIQTEREGQFLLYTANELKPKVRCFNSPKLLMMGLIEFTD